MRLQGGGEEEDGFSIPKTTDEKKGDQEGKGWSRSKDGHGG